MLQAPVVARSAHFVVHYRNKPWPTSSETAELQVVQGFSTDLSPSQTHIVDNSASTPAQRTRILGVMVPKRHAKRAVTRSLVKRLVRSIWFGIAPNPGVADGIWLVRLRQPIDRQQFPSASSDALRKALRAELLALCDQASRSTAAVAAVSR